MLAFEEHVTLPCVCTCVRIFNTCNIHSFFIVWTKVNGTCKTIFSQPITHHLLNIMYNQHWPNSCTKTIAIREQKPSSVRTRLVCWWTATKEIKKSTATYTFINCHDLQILYTMHKWVFTHTQEPIHGSLHQYDAYIQSTVEWQKLNTLVTTIKCTALRWR